MKINLNLPDSLWVLTLDVQIPLDSLKLFKNLSLTDLKIRLTESKKNIHNFVNHFMNKDNACKIFAEGRSKNTLKFLDISYSTVKLKDLKPIFEIPFL